LACSAACKWPNRPRSYLRRPGTAFGKWNCPLPAHVHVCRHCDAIFFSPSDLQGILPFGIRNVCSARCHYEEWPFPQYKSVELKVCRRCNMTPSTYGKGLLATEASEVRPVLSKDVCHSSQRPLVHQRQYLAAMLGFHFSISAMEHNGNLTCLSPRRKNCSISRDPQLQAAMAPARGWPRPAVGGTVILTCRRVTVKCHSDLVHCPGRSHREAGAEYLTVV
jgi:hypothetical protein